MANGFDINVGEDTSQAGIDPSTGLTGGAEKTKTFDINVGEGGPEVFAPDLPGKVTRGTDLKDYEKYVAGGNVFVNEGLDDARAMGQRTAEKWRNGIIKFGGKTGTAVAGGTLGVFYGLGSSLGKGDFKSFYDNDFQRMLDRWNEGMDENLANYTTKEEQDYGFFRSMGTANFWANDVLSGVSFTVGAVLTEAVWSAATAATLGAAGAGLAGATAGNVARVGRYFKNFSRAEDVAKGARNVQLASQISQTGKVGRQFITGAGYEAGVEARHHKHELSEKLKARGLQPVGRA